MFDFENLDKKLIIVKSESLYKWARSFKRVQERFYLRPSKLKREKQIEDFLYLNQFKNVFFITDTDVFNKDLHPSINIVSRAEDADINFKKKEPDENGVFDVSENPDTTNGNLKFLFVYKGDPWTIIR